MFDKLFLVISLAVLSVVLAQVGERCVLKSNGQEGVCRIAPDCPVVKEQAKQGIDPTLCGFHKLTIPIVCCESNSFIVQPNDHSFTEPENNRSQQVPLNNNLRISEQKCEEYSSAVTGVVVVSPLVAHNTEAFSISVPKCDYNTVPLIVGGEPAMPGEFPFMAAIGFNTDDEKWRCGGTLISDRYVLTAAHCTYARDVGKPTVVRLGDLNLASSNDQSEHKDYKVDKVINHPDYNYPLKYNDIALLRTETKVTFTNFIRPACLYTKRSVEQDSAIATGWGRTGFAAETSDKLRKVGLNIYDNQRCTRTYQHNDDLPRGIVSSMLCAGEIKGEKDTCEGDSGGPLLITKRGNQCKFYVVGVTSFGKSCGQIMTPAVYTRVSEYVTWIEKTIW